ncbi:hypothetical protein TWF696_008640 [Orbilia brochopaga]|uniref:Actin-like ATPase domain-containing protein n=1 Tax=Orbilia brochopaga TaxID=3140254 RepID=A0AAV9UM10_9PEZI
MDEAGLECFDMQPGDHFIVCDAGGGTVDLITYQIQQVFPDFKLRESVVGGGGKCGSTYIDEAFHRLLRDRIGPSFDDATIWTAKKKGKGSQLMQKFEACKRTFGQAGNDSWFLELPVAVEDNEEQGIVDNELELSSDDMRALFDPIVDTIIEHVAQQAGKVKAKGVEQGPQLQLVRTTRQKQLAIQTSLEGQLTAVILVGGFGESKYLYERLKKWAYRQKPRLSVINPSKSWSAIVRGAVLQALRPAVGTRKLRCHYGFALGTDYNPKLHDLKVFEIGNVPLDFSDIDPETLPVQIVDGKPRYKVDCITKMLVGSADASFSVWVGGKCYGFSRIAYND